MDAASSSFKEINFHSGTGKASALRRTLSQREIAWADSQKPKAPAFGSRLFRTVYFFWISTFNSTRLLVLGYVMCVSQAEKQFSNQTAFSEQKKILSLAKFIVCEHFPK